MFQKTTISILLFLIANGVFAQFFERTNMWKAYRNEYTFGVGLSAYNGDLGGLDKQGTNYFLFDMELPLVKYGFTLSRRLNLSQHNATSFTLYYGKVAGDDKLTGDIYRRNRNLNFSSKILEFTVNYEYYIIRQTPGHLYDIKGAKGLEAVRWDAYLFVGVGGFYFNPKSDGVALRPLGTEGQGLPGGRLPYLPVALAFPVGFGGSYKFSKRFKIGTEFAYRFTTTDYLDDASRTYYDNNAIRAARGDVAAYYADPSLNGGAWSSPADYRGDSKWRDGYLTFVVKITYLHMKRYRSGSKKHIHSFNRNGNRSRHKLKLH